MVKMEVKVHEDNSALCDVVVNEKMSFVGIRYNDTFKLREDGVEVGAVALGYEIDGFYCRLCVAELDEKGDVTRFEFYGDARI